MPTAPFAGRARNICDCASGIHNKSKPLRRRPNQEPCAIVTVEKKIIVKPHASTVGATLRGMQLSPVKFICDSQALRWGGEVRDGGVQRKNHRRCRPDIAGEVLNRRRCGGGNKKAEQRRPGDKGESGAFQRTRHGRNRDVKAAVSKRDED